MQKFVSFANEGDNSDASSRSEIPLHLEGFSMGHGPFLHSWFVFYFINSISKPAISLTLLIKRLYKPDWGEWQEWSNRFTEDIIDGKSGYELKYQGEKVITRYLRVGYELDGSWRIFSLRKDFLPAKKSTGPGK